MASPSSLTANAEQLDAGGRGERSPFLSGPPRSGELSPFAQKLAAQFFIWLASIVVFGSTADWSSKDVTHCSPICRFGIAAGVLSFLFTSFILILHYLTWSSKVDKGSWFSAAAEKRYMFLLAIWWTFGVGFLSSYQSIEGIPVPFPQTSGLAIMFAWLAFFGSIYGAYKAYHSQKEEQKDLVHRQIISMQQTEEEEYANFS